MKQPRHRLSYYIKEYWDEALAGMILLSLALFLLNIDLGFNNTVSALLATVGGIILPIILFIIATFIAPVVTFLLSTLILPIVAFFTTLASSLLAWLATTWLGAALSPILTTISPLLVKVAPFFTATKNAEWAWPKLQRLLGPYYNRFIGRVVYTKVEDRKIKY